MKYFLIKYYYLREIKEQKLIVSSLSFFFSRLLFFNRRLFFNMLLFFLRQFRLMLLALFVFANLTVDFIFISASMAAAFSAFLFVLISAFNTTSLFTTRPLLMLLLFLGLLFFLL